MPTSRTHATPRRPLMPLTADHLAALVAACDGTRPTDVRDQGILALLTTTGLRAQEVCALTLDSLREGYICVSSTKARAARDVRLTVDTEAAVRTYIMCARAPHQPGECVLFLSEEGQPIDVLVLAQIVQAAAQRAQLAKQHVTVALIRYSIGELLFKGNTLLRRR